jgi:hypothetical protein
VSERERLMAEGRMIEAGFEDMREFMRHGLTDDHEVAELRGCFLCGARRVLYLMETSIDQREGLLQFVLEAMLDEIKEFEVERHRAKNPA